MKQIKMVYGRRIEAVIKEVNITLKELPNAELVAAVERDRRISFFIQYDSELE